MTAAPLHILYTKKNKHILHLQTDKIRGHRWTGYAACMEEKRNPYWYLVGKLKQ
jgi:hypothetical protein